jgi:hypothetical protein
VVVQVIQQFHVAAYEAKSQPPICLYGDGMEPRSVAMQRIQAPRWSGQVLCPLGDTQGGQPFAQPLGMNGLYAAGLAREEKQPQAFVPKRKNREL